MHKLGKSTEAVLRAILEHQPARIRDLNALESLRATLPDTGAKPAVRALELRGLIDADPDGEPGGPYRISNLGRRVLNTLDNQNPGTLALPRQPTVAGRYDGRELAPYVGRPGAMDAYELPSLDGGDRVARARPFTLGTPPEPRK